MQFSGRDTALPMSRRNVELAYEAFDAYNRHDLGAFLALMHDDVEAKPRMAAVEGPYRGHDGIRRWWASANAAFPDFGTDVLEIRDLGDFTLAEIRNRGRGAVGGTPVEQESWHVAEWRDGKIVWWGAYGTEAEALEAAG
jgi:ketosteroid isomerase-like protein